MDTQLVLETWLIVTNSSSSVKTNDFDQPPCIKTPRILLENQLVLQVSENSILLFNKTQ